MDKQLMDIVLPGLARRLHKHLERYQCGELDDDQLSKRFASVLQKQYAWLAERGVPEAEAALVIHAAVLVLSGPGLRAEASREGVPLEVVERRAVWAAAREVADSYEISQHRATRQLSAILARYGD
ncbi:MAG TPA: hypothetical protein VFA26_06215 [Gemmataceae bacterium]|nr:hypothetical protein [Gemmataceae bacterium]